MMTVLRVMRTVILHVGHLGSLTAGSFTRTFFESRWCSFTMILSLDPLIWTTSPPFGNGATMFKGKFTTSHGNSLPRRRHDTARGLQTSDQNGTVVQIIFQL